MKNHTAKQGNVLDRVRPLTDQHEKQSQPYGTIVKLPIGLAESACKASVENLNQLIADTMTLRDMYKKHHWQVVGPIFYQLHLLYDKHYKEQVELVDLLAERIQTLGGVTIAMAHDVAETTTSRDCPEVGKTLRCNCLVYSMRMKSSYTRPERWPDRPLNGVMTGPMILS